MILSNLNLQDDPNAHTDYTTEASFCVLNRRRRTYRCVLRALAEGRRECFVRQAEHEVAVERHDGYVEVPDLDVAMRVAEAEVHGQVVPESIGPFRRRGAGVEGGEDGGVDSGVEAVGVVSNTQDDGGDCADDEGCFTARRAIVVGHFLIS